MTNTDDSMNIVRFHPIVQVTEVLNIDNYTPYEIAASWYSEEEMEKITNRAFKVIKSMDAGRGRKYCIRGLEGHSRLGCITKRRSRSTSIAAVLQEQSRQWIDQRVDEQAIADVYERTTSSCHMWAQVMGRQDRRVADAVLCQNEEEDCMDETRVANESRECTANKSNECTISSTVHSSSQRSAARIQIATDTATHLRSSRSVRLAVVH